MPIAMPSMPENLSYSLVAAPGFLEALRDAGILTHDEFAAKRALVGL
jgi:hypothetical protein